jgi:hypothetical protein
MSFTTDPGTRQAFITGLRDLADYLDQHPAVPVPAYGTEIYLNASSTDDGGCAQVAHFARQLGVPVPHGISYSGHYEAARRFGPVGYRMLAISDDAMARHYALSSYSGAVTPDPRPDTWT